MGEVYKALDTRLNRFVAIKVLPAGMSADPECRRRFIQEGQAASALNHPNIITIYDVVHDGDTQYMVMEFVAGKTLLELIPQGGLPVPAAIGYATQMTDALNTAHAAGIVHRDLKPANVMVTGRGLVKLLDFGLAKLMAWPGPESSGNTVTLLHNPLTVAGAIMGTVNYMSPEQASGGKLDARSDIFSFGAVFYEMLTGRPAFRGTSPVSTLSAVLRDDVQPVVQLKPGVPLELEQIVLRCLMKDPDQRFQSMQELNASLAALRRHSDSDAFDSPPTVRTVAPGVTSGGARRSWAAVAIGVLVALVLIAAAGGYWWMGRKTSPAPPVRSQTPSHAARSTPADGVLTNDRIIDMVQASVTPSLIESQIRTSKTNFDLSASEVIRLSKAGVPPDVIEVMRNPSAPPPPSMVPFILTDGLPVRLIVAADSPADAAQEEELRFRVARDVRTGGSVVIASGAPAIGSIVDGAKKKMIVFGSKMTFRLETVAAVDGKKIAIRATPAPGHDGISKRAVTSPGKKPKDLAAVAGTEYLGYVDGGQTVMLKQ